MKARRDFLTDSEYAVYQREYIAIHVNYTDEDFSLEGVKLLMGVDKLPADKLENIQFWDRFNAKRRVMMADALMAELNK